MKPTKDTGSIEFMIDRGCGKSRTRAKDFLANYYSHCGYYCTGKSIYCTKHPKGPSKNEQN